jgi:uncharacterized protein
MNDVHPNLALLRQLTPGDFSGTPEIFAEDVVFHYYNPKLPDLHGDYAGLVGIKSFFGKLGTKTKGSFRVNPVSVSAVGDELVVMQTVNTLTIDGNDIAIDVVLVWRIVDNRIKEIWDIPSIYTKHVDTASS